MKKSSRKKTEEIDYWQSQSDLLTGLLLVLLMIILLLSLYIIHMPEDAPDFSDGNYIENEGEGGGDGGGAFVTFTPSPTPTPTLTPTPTPHLSVSQTNSHSTDDDDEEEEEEEEEEEGEEEPGAKAAVYVMLVDGETNLTLKEEGVLFDLYGEKGGLKSLNTYYPEKITYREFATTGEGVFFLPEKIDLGSYYLHGITTPTGYDDVPNVHFTIEDIYDWPEPYVVRVPVYPSRNVIRVQLLDYESGQTVAGASFEVEAMEDVITLDGTRRYRKGEIVATIGCDENGYGVSEELYVGSYRIRQLTIPSYYSAVDDEDLELELGYRTGSQEEINTLHCHRTSVLLHLCDELYPARSIEGAVFRVSTRSGSVSPFTVATDSQGNILLDSLEKDETYLIKQEASVGDYYPDISEYRVPVSAEGLIDGEPTLELELTNWVLRVRIAVADALLGSPVSDIHVALYDSKDRLIHSFSSGGSPTEIEDLDEGTYHVILNGDTSKSYELRVKNTKEIQTLTVRLFSRTDIGLIAGAALVLVCLLLVIVLVRRKKTR